MCGIAGVMIAESVDFSESTLHRMGDAIVSRGPDDSGVWMDRVAGVGLVHRRLSIVDLSLAGHQPMFSASGRYVLVFNGEIYNHLDLRTTLESAAGEICWRGHSDTETLLAGFDAWGIEETVRRSVGMFAFAVWDKSEHVLTLGRDRLGEKPLYYGWQGDIFLFGSELKALKAHPAFVSTVDRNALTLLMRHNAIPAPYSIYQDIHKLLPGTLLSLSLQQRNAEPRYYWDARQVVASALSRPFVGSGEDAVEELERLLRQSIAGQMVADVPLGAFLSGGIDSSTVAALMQAQSNRPVRTFSIGFNEAAYNEAEHARAVARHLGTAHEEFYVTPQQALDVISRLPSLYCEPFADSSQIPTFLVSQLARQHVTVALSGDGGDELFGGYSRYVQGNRLWGKLSHLPLWLRGWMAQGIQAVPPRLWNRMLAPVQSVLPRRLKFSNIGDKLHKGSCILTAQSLSEVYRSLTSHWIFPESLVLGAHEPATALTDMVRQPHADNAIHQMMALDLVSYLPDDILTKVDRAAMAVSLETRVPLLDHRIVEFAWRLPLSSKIKGGVGKWPLRQVLYKYVPRDLIERPKMGFGVPIEHWLRGALREWAEDLLDESRLRREGFFNPEPIRQKWQEHLSGRRNWQYLLWDVLMFQTWLMEQ
jgi:asparagine synthase (glutamine-hydrolysing)